MSKIPCTAAILTRNSAATLERALESVKDFAEIVVCDGGSTDDTLAIAARYGARVIAQDKAFLDAEGYIQNFSGVRNQTVEAARHEWYFWLDSDEYASPGLVAEVARVVKERHEGAFNVFRRYVLQDGREVTCCSSYPNRSMRLFSKRSVGGFRKIVHERPVMRDGVTPEDLSCKLFVPVDPDRAGVARRNDRYIALEMKRKGRVGFFKYCGYARGELRALLGYTARLVRGRFFCRGTRFPLSMECGRYRYVFKLLAAIWRARSYEYPPVVLFFTNKWKTGGAELQMLQEISFFQDRGIDVRYGTVYDAVVPAGIDARHTIFPIFRRVADVPAYVRLLSRIGDEGVTHVVATLDHAMIVARVAAIFASRIRVVVMEAGMADRKPLRYKLFDMLFNWRVRAVIAESNGIADSLSYLRPFYKKKIVVVHNGVDTTPHGASHELPEHFTVLAVGSLRREKGFDILLAAFAKVLQEVPDAHLVIIGRGALADALRRQAQNLGIESHVNFMGEIPREEVRAWYRRVHVFAFPSVSEGFGLVLVEAMSEGVCAIASRSAGALDIVEDEVSGLLVPVGDSDAMAEGIVRLYRNPALRERIAESGIQRAQQFSFDRHARLLADLLGIADKNNRL